MRLLLALVAGALALAGCGQAQAAERCGRHDAVLSADAAARPLPPLTGHVVDRAGLLSAQMERRLVRELEGLEAATTDELVVVTVPSLDGEAIESLGLRLGNGWGVGKADLDNGVLLIVAPREREARIEVACGLDGLLADERAQEIMDTVLIPHFAGGRFEQGVQAGVAAIGAILRSNRRRPQPWRETPS